MPFDPLVELAILVRSRYGVIILDTADHDRADAIIRQGATTGTDTPMGALRADSAQAAPVVLWIDEIEKAFATDGNSIDGGLDGLRKWAAGRATPAS